MQKTAQKRSVLNKLREMTNVSGIAAEKFFNPQFKVVMDTIRKKDDQIRTFVSGKHLGDAEDMPMAPPLKDVLKQAKSNLNRREFMACATDLGTFHEQMKNVVNEINTIDHKVDEVHHDFLFEKLTPEQQQQLAGFNKKFAEQQAALKKEASIMDFFHNIGTSRGRALAAWEKRYPNEVGKFKVGLTTLVQNSDVMLESTLDALKEMAAARSVRHVDDYMKAAGKITKAFNKYENGKGGFKEFYTGVLKPYVAKLEDYKARKSMDETMTSIPAAKSPAGGPSITPEEADKLVTKPTVSPLENGPALDILEKQHGSPNIVEPIRQAPPPIPHAITPVNTPGEVIISPVGASPTGTQTDEELGNKSWSSLAPASAHRKFYSALESLSSESPVMLGMFIKKYANSIKTSDPKVANQLLQISKRIKG